MADLPTLRKIHGSATANKVFFTTGLRKNTLSDLDTLIAGAMKLSKDK